MLHLFPLSKGLGSAFAWLLLSVSHKGQEKKNKIKGKKPILHNNHTTHFHKIKSCQLSQHECPGQPQHNPPTNTIQSTLQGELKNS